MLKNLANLRLETHVEHAISLVEHDVRRGRHVHHAAFQQIVQATRGGDADLRTVAQLLQLTPLGRAPVQAHRPDAARRAKLHAFLLNLRREFARRRERQHHRPSRVAPITAFGDVHQTREQERHRLPAPRLRHGDHIVPLQRDRPRLRLNRRRLGVSRALHRVQQRLRPRSRVKVHHRIGHRQPRRRSHANLVPLSKIIPTLRRAVPQILQLQSFPSTVRVRRRRVVLLRTVRIIRAQVRERRPGVPEISKLILRLRRLRRAIVRRHVRRHVPIIHLPLRVHLLPSRGQSHGRHRSLHHRVSSRVKDLRFRFRASISRVLARSSRVRPPPSRSRRRSRRRSRSSVECARARRRARECDAAITFAASHSRGRDAAATLTPRSSRHGVSWELYARFRAYGTWF